VCEPLLQAFPFPRTLGEVTLHPLSLACVFIYSSCGEWVFPQLLWSFTPTDTFTSFPAPGCWAHTPTPTRASLARPSLFIYRSGKDSPPLLFGAQGAPPSLQHVFIVLIAYYSVSLFSLGKGWSVQGSYAVLAQGCLWEYCVPLSSPCPCLPKPSGHGQLVAQGPSWFLRFT
jgi:hypothetical protein